MDELHRALAYNLTGPSLPRPRLRTPANVWRKTQRTAIDQAVKRQGVVPRNEQVKVRDKVAREMFENLPIEERDLWAKQAKEEHEAALEAWKTETQVTPSSEPADQQRSTRLLSFLMDMADFTVDAYKTLPASPNPSLT
jgi:hypothetical protein